MAKWEDGARGESPEPDPLAETGPALNRALGAYWAAKGWRNQRVARDRLYIALDQHFKAVGEFYSGYPMDETPAEEEERMSTDEGKPERRDPPPYYGPRGETKRLPYEDEPPNVFRRGAHRRARRWWQIWRAR